MCPLVILQGTRPGESLVTLGAGIRFLSTVDSHVSPQGIWLGKGLGTLGAGVRSLANVGYFVCLQATGLGERFVTSSAKKGLFSSMGQVV